MEATALLRRLCNTSVYDMNVHSAFPSLNGWKISIQGKSVNDSVFLYERLSNYLMANDIPFKVATINRYALLNINKEQSHKAMTIYCIDGFDFAQLCENVYSLVMDYTGWHDIKTPASYQHYAGGLYIRNDRDENGNYIKAN